MIKSERAAANLAIGGVSLLSLAAYVMSTLPEVGHTTFDDAYMVTRYARHWLDGHGFCWNIADGPSFGITSPAYLFLITALLGLTGGSDAAVLTATSFSAGLLAVIAMVVLGFFMQRGREAAASWLPLLVIPAVIFMPPFRFHSLTGMETTLSLLMNTLLVGAVYHLGRRPSARALTLTLMAGVGSFAVRPDNGIYALGLPVLYLLVMNRSHLRYAVLYGATFAGLLGVGMIINKFLFGDFLPLPVLAKTSGFYLGYLGATKWNSITGMLLFFVVALPFLLLAISVASKQAMGPLSAVILCLLATFGYYATVTQIMGHQARYYYPSLALVVFGGFLGLYPPVGNASAPPSLDRAFSLRVIMGLLVMIPALSFSFQQLATHLWERYAMGIRPEAVGEVTPVRPEERTLPDLGWWKGITSMSNLIAALPPDIVLAASEYGYIGSRFPALTILDFVGLHDRQVARSGDAAGYVLSRQPDLIWFPHSDYTHMVDSLLHHEEFQAHYAFYPEAYNFGLALRKDSPRYETIRNVVERHLFRLYQNVPPVRL